MKWMRQDIHRWTHPKASTSLVAAILFVMVALVEGAPMTPTQPAIALPDHTAGWRWDGNELAYDARGLFAYMNGGAELYVAYGVHGLRVRKFERPDRPPITLELYDMASSEDAWGVFSFERQDDDAGIGQGSEFGGGLLRFWKGTFFVRVYADGEGADVDAAILALGRATAAAIQETGSAPALVALLPGADLGLLEKTVRYLRSHVLLNQRLFIAHENILRLGRRTEAVLAQYRRAGKTVHLLLVRYPSAEEASEAAESFRTVHRSEVRGKEAWQTGDGKWATIRQRNGFILYLAGGATAADAEGLLKATEEQLPEKPPRQ